MNLDAARTRSSTRGSYEEYHPYGSTAWWAGTSGLVSQKRYRFTGLERDDETGLQCHGVRYYAVWLGRWVSADPIGLGDGVNRFGYCHGGPVRDQDRTGLLRDPGAEEEYEDQLAGETITVYAPRDGPTESAGEKVGALIGGLLVGAISSVAIGWAAGFVAGLGPVGAAIVAIGAVAMLAATVYSVVKHWDEIKDTAGRLVQGTATSEEYFGAGAIVGGLLAGGAAKGAFTAGSSRGVQASSAAKLRLHLALGADTSVLATTTETIDGLLVARTGNAIRVSMDSETYIAGRVSGDSLYIEMVQVAKQLQGNKLSYRLYQAIVEAAGPGVKRIEGQLAYTNEEALQRVVPQLTPAAKAHGSAGFTQHSYDPESGLLTSERPPQ